MQLFDLSVSLNDTPVYPGDPTPEITEATTIKKDGFAMRKLTLLTHHGTHVDAPSHMIVGGKHLSDFPLETFVGETIILDARSSEPEHDRIKSGDIVFFVTGKEGAIAAISPTIAERLVEKRIKIFGLDALTPDSEPFETHKIFLQNNILIVENLTGLEPLIGKRLYCAVLPLKLTATDGAPCRVIAGLV